MNLKPTLLIKFGNKEFMESLLIDGLIYCNSIKWFAEHKDGGLRGDKFEAVVRTRYMENEVWEMKVANDPDAPWLKLNITKAHYQEYYRNPLGNLFCLSVFDVEPGSFELDGYMRKFGEYFVLIRNQAEFFRRIKICLDEMGIGFCHGRVEYLDLKTHTGERGLYQKHLSYKFQREYRFHIHTDVCVPFSFKLGNIEDIASVYRFENACRFQIR